MRAMSASDLPRENRGSRLGGDLAFLKRGEGAGRGTIVCVVRPWGENMSRTAFGYRPWSDFALRQSVNATSLASGVALAWAVSCGERMSSVRSSVSFGYLHT